MNFWEFRPLLGILSVSLLLSACGSSSGGDDLPDSPQDITPPRVIAASVDEDEDIEIDEPIIVTFSELIDTSSIADNLQLFSKESEGSDLSEQRDVYFVVAEVLGVGRDLVTGETIDISATEMVVRPVGDRFSLDTNYEFRINTGIRDVADSADTPDEDESNTMLNEYQLSFTTQSGRWSNQSLTYEQEIAGSIYNHAADSNTKGDLVLSWEQDNDASGLREVWLSHYAINAIDIFSEWSVIGDDDPSDAIAEKVSNATLTSALEPDVVTNDAGKSAVIWRQSADVAQTETPLWIRVHETDWETPINLSGDLTDARDSGILMNDHGDILVVWRESDGTDFKLRYRFYDDANGWTAAATIANDIAGEVVEYRLNWISDDEPILIWTQTDGAGSYLYSSTLVSGTGWSTAVRLDSQSGGVVSKPSFDVGRNGDAIAIWEETLSGVKSLWWAQFTARRWRTEDIALFEFDDTEDYFEPLVVASPYNEFFAIWKQGNASSHRLNNKIYSAGTGWEIGETSLTSGNIDYVEMNFDNEGNANLLVASGSISAQRYLRDNGWQNRRSVDGSSGVALDVSLLSLKTDGRMMSLWHSFENPEYSLKYSIFSDNPDGGAVE